MPSHGSCYLFEITQKKLFSQFWELLIPFSSVNFFVRCKNYLHFQSKEKNGSRENGEGMLLSLP